MSEVASARRSAGGNHEHRQWAVEFSLVDFYHYLQRLVGVDTVKLSGPAIANIMDKLRAGFEDGYLRTAPIERWSLDQAIDAYTAVETRTSLNKQVFIPHGT
jgi:NADPH2:quinone reductase